MKHFCKYHPTSPATWNCKHCQISYDYACMPDADEKKRRGICPNCHHELQYLDLRQVPPPFWQILPQFFLFPIRKEPLLVIILSGLFSLGFLGHYLLALAASIVIIDLVTHYGYLIITKESFTLKRPPSLGMILSFSGFKKRLFVGLLMGLSLVIPLLAAQYAHPLFAIFLGLLAFWFLPAAIMVKCRQGEPNLNSSLENNLNINALLEPMIRMSWAYIALVCGIITTVITSLILIDFAHQHLQEIVTPLISATTFSYFSLVLFSLLAYILIEYKSFSPAEQSPDQKNTKTRKVRALHEVDTVKRRDADIDIALKQGNYTQLVTHLEKELKRQSFSDLRRDQLYKLLLALNDNQRLEKYAHSFLTLMLGRGKVEDAAQFIQARRQYNSEFALYDLALSKRLADAFHEHNEYQLVVWLAFKAHTRFKPTPDLAELYLRAAKTLLTKLHDKNKAREHLNYIVTHFPNQAVSASAKILLKLMQKPQTVNELNP